MTSDKNTQISSISHVDYDDTYKKRGKSPTTRSLAQETVHITESQRIDSQKLPMIESNHTYTPTQPTMQPSLCDAMTDQEHKAAAGSQSLNTHTSPLRGFGGMVSGQGNLNPPLSQAKKATKFEIISVQELDADEIDDGEESGEDAEDSTSELQSNQSRGSTCDDGSVLQQNASRSLNSNLQSAPKTSTDAVLSRQSMPMVPEVTSAPSVVNPNYSSISSNGETIPQVSQKIGHITGNPGFVYGRTDSGEIFLPMSSALNNSSGVNFVDCSNSIIQPGINNDLVSVFRQHAQGQINAATGGVGNILSQQTAVSTLNPIISQNQGQLNAQHSTLNSTLGAYSIGPQAAVTAAPILPSRFRVVKKVKPFVGKRGRWDCRDVPCDVIMTSVGHSRSNPQTAGPLPQNSHTLHAAALQHNIGLSVNPNAADQFCNSSGAALSKASQQVASNYNTSFALTEDISGSTKNPVHVPLVSHVGSQRSVDVGQSFRPIRDTNMIGEQVGNFPIAALDEALSSVTTTSDPVVAGKQLATDEHSDSTTTTGGGGTYNNLPFLTSNGNFNINWARRSSTAEESTSSTVSNLANGDVLSNGGGGAANRCSTGSEETTAPEGMDGVTRKLVQVMEVVKTHVVLTVQEEFDLMKSELEEMRARNAQLEAENSFFRQKQLTEAASGGKRRDASVQVTLPNSPNQTMAQDSTVTVGLKPEANKENTELNASANAVGTTSVPPQMNSNLPYVVLGFGNSSLAAVSGAAHLQQTTPGDFQPFIQRQAQFQPVGYFPMSLVNYGPQIGAASLVSYGIKQSGDGQMSLQLMKNLAPLSQESSNSNSTSVQQIGQSSVNQTSTNSSSFAKNNTSESGRNSLEPVKEARKVSTISEPGLSLPSMNDLASSSNPNTIFPQMSGSLSHSSNQVTPLSAATASLQQQMQSALTNSTTVDYALLGQNRPPTSNNPQAPQISTITKTNGTHQIALSGLIPGAEAPGSTSQPLLYMPSVALQPMAPAAATGFSLSMVQQLQNANMHYANPVVPPQMIGSANQTVLPSGHNLLQQSTFSTAGLNAFADSVATHTAGGGGPAIQPPSQQFFQINSTGAFPLNSAASNTVAVAPAQNQQHQLQQASNSLAVSGANLGADVNQMNLADPISYTVVSAAAVQTSQVVHGSVAMGGGTTGTNAVGSGTSTNNSASVNRS